MHIETETQLTILDSISSQSLVKKERLKSLSLCCDLSQEIKSLKNDGWIISESENDYVLDASQRGVAETAIIDFYSKLSDERLLRNRLQITRKNEFLILREMLSGAVTRFDIRRLILHSTPQKELNRLIGKGWEIEAQEQKDSFGNQVICYQVSERQQALLTQELESFFQRKDGYVEFSQAAKENHNRYQTKRIKGYSKNEK